MRTSILLALTLLIVSCGKTEAPKNDGEGVQADTSTSNTFNAGAPGNTGNGPTGSSDPVDPTELPGYTPPPGGDTGVVVTPGPTLTEVCGVVYASFYDDVIRLYEDENTTHIIGDGDYSATYYFSAARFSYPNDAMEVCVQSYMDNGVLMASLVNIVNADAMHPERPLGDSYAHEVCGEFKYTTDNGGRTYLEANDNGTLYIVVDENMPALTLPPFTDGEGAAITAKGCMYSNQAPYNDYSYTFKKHLRVEAYDFGPLIPEAVE